MSHADQHESGVVHARAWAKVNLALSVGPPEPAGSARAGMHPIVSWMQCIDLADDVRLRPLADGASSAYSVAWHDGSSVAWPMEQDLAVQAHQLLEHEAGRSLPADLEVRKRIPAGAGLGGGSSDAAAVLLATNRAFSLGISAARLAELSRVLGSDVSFFIDEVKAGQPPRAGIVSGFGEWAERIGSAHGALVLIVPPFGCATGDVYRAFDALGPGSLRDAEVRRLSARPLMPDSLLFNDLAEAAERVQPQIAEVRRACGSYLKRPVHVTGSGSALFALCSNVEESEELATGLESRIKDVCVQAARLVPPI